jgi:hypothetical protein
VNNRPARASESVLDRLLRLDCPAKPGLSEAEFRHLFAKCICGLVMTRRVFKDHLCAVGAAGIVAEEDTDAQPPAFVDLTVDSD